MISNQETLNLSPYMAIYDIVVPKDNMLRQVNELVEFSFFLEELKTKYCLDNGRNTIPPIRMFKYLLLKAMNDVSDVDLVERSKYDMSFGYGNRRSSETEIRHFLFKIEQEVPYFYLKKVRFYENINFSVPSSIHEGRFK